MRKSKLLPRTLPAAALLLVPMVTMAGIVGTQHDLSTKGWGSTELCIFCHTPHNANKSVSEAPLWNHKVTTAYFTPYSSPTFNATMGQPGGSSKLCLSCHDGTVAVDSFGNANGSTMISSASQIGPDLSADHPISFAYTPTLAANDGKLVIPVSSSKVDAAGLLPLFNTLLECGTCHDAHENVNQHFLRVANTGSALCLKCHNK